MIYFRSRYLQYNRKTYTPQKGILQINLKIQSKRKYGPKNFTVEVIPVTISKRQKVLDRN